MIRWITAGAAAGCLALFVAAATVLTVFIISASYSQIIEAFPSGGGGYIVATKLLGSRFGVVSGCALLVDYVLTISRSQGLKVALDWDGDEVVISGG